jgi:hypothetical protein
VPRKAIGDRPMTSSELQARWRERNKARRALAEEAVAFVLRLDPSDVPVRGLAALQRRLRQEQPATR